MKRSPGSVGSHDPHHHTAPADLEDPRDALELKPEENADLCAGCVKCCTYIAVEVDAPRAAWEYDQWIWALHHQGIELYVERPERWYLHVEARCRQLNDQGRCGIYGRHPVLCREYDPRSCERRLPLADIRAWFKSAQQLEDWIRRERPKHWRALERYRKPQRGVAPPPAATAAPAFVALTSLVAGTAPPQRPLPQRPAGPAPRRRAFQSDRRRKASSGVS
jgi:Fe-S-cluster containining protein